MGKFFLSSRVENVSMSLKVGHPRVVICHIWMLQKLETSIRRSLLFPNERGKSRHTQHTLAGVQQFYCFRRDNLSQATFAGIGGEGTLRYRQSDFMCDTVCVSRKSGDPCHPYKNGQRHTTYHSNNSPNLFGPKTVHVMSIMFRRYVLWENSVPPRARPPAAPPLKI